jgi:hypothetical protein
MRLALLIVVFHIFQRGECRLGKNIEALCAGIVDWTLGFDGEDVGLAVLFGVKSCKLAVVLAINALLAYLLLILRKCLVLFEELRNVGLVGYFEHGDSLDGHSGGGACGDIAVNGASEECEECGIAHRLCQGDDTTAWRHVWHILGPWFGDKSVSVSTVSTSRLVINYLKTIGAPIVYRLRTWGSGAVLLACMPVYIHTYIHVRLSRNAGSWQWWKGW